MFSNKNNHLIKKIQQTGSSGSSFGFNPVSNVPNANHVSSVPVPEPNNNNNNNNKFTYPRDDYLYYKITSQDVHDNIKVYVCMFSTVKGFATFHTKKDTDVSIPSPLL